jgi:hypothetical protein
VTLKFPGDAQVRYIDRIPQEGDRIRGLANEDFVVSSVEREDGGYKVTCVPHPNRGGQMTAGGLG